MNASRRYILLLILISGSVRPVWAQEPAPSASEKPAEAQVDPQIAINKKSLLDGNEETRLVAAGLLLRSEHPQARSELLSVLGDPNHPDARAAICKALTAAREDKRPLANRDDFIGPLMAALSVETDPARAELTAQALLMFPYDSVSAKLEHLTADPNATEIARLNSVRALKYQPDDRAIFKLVELIGVADANLAAESKKALVLLGIDIPDDPNVVQILTERLTSRGPEAFLKNPLILKIWLVSRGNRITELTSSLRAREQRYLAALDKLYIAQPDEKASSEFLKQQLESADAAVKVWALGKLEELRTGTDKGKVSAEVEGAILGLISNRDRHVRLKTAGLLTLMPELNAATQLLEQLRVEADLEVRHGLFVALGTACYYASSTVKVPEEIRRETLELAVQFLGDKDPEKVRSGADVIRKLLEQNGLKPEDIEKYLTALADRYRQGSPSVNHGLRAELLGAMGGLCGPRSVCRAHAAKLYSPVFEEALADELESVRQAAVDGLVNTGKAAALQRLTPDFINDPSAAVRAKVINLAGEVGVVEDLDWLLKKVGKNGEDELAWQATVKILRRANAEGVGIWLAALDGSVGPEKLSVDRRIAVITILEQKAQAEKQQARLVSARMELFALYAAKNDTPRAVEYMDATLGAAGSGDDRQNVAMALLDVCLRPATLREGLAATLIEKYLAGSDLGPGYPLAVAINGFLTAPPAGADPNALLERVRKIDVGGPDARPQWHKLLVEWEKFAKAQPSEKIDKASN